MKRSVKFNIKFEAEIEVLRETDPEEVEAMGGEPIDGKNGGYWWEVEVTSPLYWKYSNQDELYYTEKEAYQDAKERIIGMLEEKMGNQIL